MKKSLLALAIIVISSSAMAARKPDPMPVMCKYSTKSIEAFAESHYQIVSNGNHKYFNQGESYVNLSKINLSNCSLILSRYLPSGKQVDHWVISDALMDYTNLFLAHYASVFGTNVTMRNSNIEVSGAFDGHLAPADEIVLPNAHIRNSRISASSIGKLDLSGANIDQLRMLVQRYNYFDNKTYVGWVDEMLMKNTYMTRSLLRFKVNYPQWEGALFEDDDFAGSKFFYLGVKRSTNLAQANIHRCNFDYANATGLFYAKGSANSMWKNTSVKAYISLLENGRTTADSDKKYSFNLNK